ncbi:MAG: enoyl-CoA hydratase [Hydrogenophaga sp.]|uniref:enoyl-CoA hydratase n=1 Tax=Ottowia sp. TaxID=1898956 RepID=UPI00262A1FC6|nr:enoyl-CoA hydratase [Ottowia sp.]
MGDSLAVSEELLVNVADGVAILTLNRPEQHNALSRALRGALVATLTSIATDDRVGVVIFTGAGDKAFCAGADFKEMEHSPLQPEELGPDAPLMRAFRELHKPTIAAINGFALTGGFELAVNCDILVASTNARFADTHARVGLVSAWGLTQHLPRAIGPVRARYLSFTGNYLDAQTALAWGLVLDVLPPDELMPYCLGIARDILSCDAAALRDVREAIAHGLGAGLDAGLRFEGELARRSLARFDVSAFVGRRAETLARGKAQAESKTAGQRPPLP